ncbi:MAG: hypothetical protein NC121_20240 [Blautia sp.]|nr:hypothetical protein [Blautia sp.]
MKQFVKRVYSQFTKADREERHTLMHLQAKSLIKNNTERGGVVSLKDVEFKVYSQWGEEGIIQYLINTVPVLNKTFIEFGVQDYTEANTRFLLEEDNWSGMIMDGSKSNMDAVKKENIYWRYDLEAFPVFITRENINTLLLKSGFDSDLGLLSIDIDGNDYWVWKEINVMEPRIVICEYNPIFGNKEEVTTIYRPDFYRTQEHYSNLLFGASLQALISLGKEKGYTFIGTCSNAANAFFVRNDLAGYLPRTLLEDQTWYEYKSRQARDEKGNLLFLNHEDEWNLIRDCLIWDIRDNCQKKVREIER